ncbi:ribonucleases P/MRP protein subunit POP1-like [Magnolia sinica]|uniref:ribonucleases P/MRP protein subunit POP1-like n=1 Tax=Magnolia sinica TaxID=86752 RepID=UPI00265A9858|nr:ribonucleases P/MRP protein subunit POP1-like [Magnolia sinica]
MEMIFVFLFKHLNIVPCASVVCGCSTKPVVEAFCEAALLAQLRGDQWSEMQEKGRPEIFVLVRNPRSAAYQLALATIVVEQQAEDMEFTTQQSINSHWHVRWRLA